MFMFEYVRAQRHLHALDEQWGESEREMKANQRIRVSGDLRGF